MKVELKAGERIDELQRNGYQIIQNENGFCFGMDAVLLSGFAKVKKGENALDLGTRYPELSRSCWKQRRKEDISLVWRFRRPVQIWHNAVCV